MASNEHVDLRKIENFVRSKEKTANFRNSFKVLYISLRYTLREKCPYSDYSGLYFATFGLNNSEYGHVLRTDTYLKKVSK